MTEYLTNNEVATQINNWLEDKITSAQISIWAAEYSNKWENEELELEQEDLLLDILYELRFADWLDSVPEEYLATEADCSLSKEDAKKLIQKLHYIDKKEQASEI